MNIQFVFIYDTIIVLTIIITAVFITGYLWQLTGKTAATRWFLAAFVALTLLSFTSFLEVSLLIWGDLFYAVTILLAVCAQTSLIQFAYCFPVADQPREARGALFISGGVMLVTLGAALHYISQYMTTPLPFDPLQPSLTILMCMPLLGALATIAVLLRRTIHFAHQNPTRQQRSLGSLARAVTQPATSEAMTLHAFVLALMTGCIPAVSTILLLFGIVTAPVAAYMAGFGLLALLVALFLTYLNYAREQSSFTARIFSVSLVLLLTLLSAIALIAIDARNDQFQQTRVWQLVTVQQALAHDTLTDLPAEVHYIAMVTREATPIAATGAVGATYEPLYVTPDRAPDTLQFLAAEDQLRLQPGILPDREGVRTMDYIRELTTLAAYPTIWRFADQPFGSIPQYIGYRLQNGDQEYEIGFLLSSDLAYISQENLKIIGLFIISSLVLWLALPLLFRRSLIRPLSALLDGVQQANTGNLHVHLPVQHEDEIGFLTRSFNTTITTLRESATRLEQRVTERTADLAHANARLQQEIADRERIAAALRESEEKYRNVSERANDGIVIVQDQVIKYCNSRIADMLGRSVEEILHAHPNQFVAPDCIPIINQRMMQRMRGEPISSRYEITLINQAGRHLAVEINASLMEYEGQRAILAFVRDITERKEAEAALRQREEQYRLLAENMYDVVWTMNLEGHFTYVSPSVYHLRGYTPEEVLQQPMDEILTAESLRVVEQQIEESRRTGNYQVDRLELEQPCKDGSTVWTECITVPIYDPAGHARGWVGVSRDISDRRQAAQELRQAKEAAEAASRAKSTFLANMSHELRTPLNAILGFAQLMLHHHSMPPEHRDHLEIIYRSGDHLLNVINSVLDLSKIEADRMTLHETDVNLHRILEDIEGMFRLRERQTDVQMIFECASDVPPFVRTDEVKLRQVLINLLANALKFTRQGSVTLRVSAAPSVANSAPVWLHFAVIDTGAGIAQEEIDQIFEAFVQTCTGQETRNGTGLGLAISHRFVQMMGGDITVTSEVGCGTTFAFAIPVAVVAMPELQDTEDMPPISGLAPGQAAYRLLIVDDRQDTRALLVQLLAPPGFEVREARDGQEAIEVWQTWQPHAILMDMRLPVLDGYEATRRIRAADQDQHTVIIALTANTFEEEQSRVLTVGCDTLIRKPFRAAEIFAALHRYLGVRYVYALPGSPAPLAAPVQADSLDNEHVSAALHALPDRLLRELEQAALHSDIAHSYSILARVAIYDNRLAARLQEMVDRFEYEQLRSLLNERKSVQSR